MNNKEKRFLFRDSFGINAEIEYIANMDQKTSK